MKINISMVPFEKGNNILDNEYVIYDMSAFSNVIKTYLINIHKNIKNTLIFLEKILKEKNLKSYYLEDNDDDDEKFSKIINVLYREYYEKFSEIFINASIEQNATYEAFLFFLQNHIYNKNKNKFGSFLIIENKDLIFIIEMIEGALKRNGLYERTIKLTDVLNNIYDKDLKKQKTTNDDFGLKLLLKTIKEKMNEIKYLLIEEEDESFEYFSMYKKINKISYKNVFLSEDFREYLENNDFDNQDFNNMDELMEIYFTDVKEINYVDEISEYIILNKVESNLFKKEKI